MKPYEHNSTDVRNSQDLRDVYGKVVATYEPSERLLRASRRTSGMLRQPRAWAFDTAIIEQARALGATWIRVHCTDTNIFYAASLADFIRYSLPVNRGQGAQLALVLPRWAILTNDNDPQPEPERPAQLSLAFGGAR